MKQNKFNRNGINPRNVKLFLFGVVSLLFVVGIFAQQVGHPADEITAGTFGAGDFTFQGDVGLEQEGEVFLYINNTDDGRAYALISTGGGGMDPGMFSIYDMTYEGGGISRLVIDTYGDVGIGKTDPAQKLDVDGNVVGDNLRNAQCPDDEYVVGFDVNGNIICRTDCIKVSDNGFSIRKGLYYAPFQQNCEGNGWTLTFATRADNFNVAHAIPSASSGTITSLFENSAARYTQLPSHTEEMFACTTDGGTTIQYATYNKINGLWDQSRSYGSIVGILGTQNGEYFEHLSVGQRGANFPHSGYTIRDLRGERGWGQFSSTAVPNNPSYFSYGSAIHCFSNVNQHDNTNAWLWHFVR